MKAILKKAADNWAAVFLLAFFAVTLVYIVTAGDGIYLQIHDNLDSNIAIYKMMKDSRLFWSFGTRAPMLGGLDRNYLVSDLNPYPLLHMAFPTLAAVITAWYLKIAMAAAGFVFLGRTVYGRECDANLFAACGFIYGIMPTYPTTPFGFASLPILMAVMIRLYRKWDVRYIPVLVLYPMLSYFSVFGLFICGFILLFFIIDFIARRKPAWRILAALAAVSAGYVIADWRLFYVMFASGEETIRSTFADGYATTLQALKLFGSVFVKHLPSAQTYFLLPVCAAYFLFINGRYILRKEYKGISSDPFNWLMLWQAFNCMVYALENVRWFKNLIGTVFPPLKGMALNRTVWFSPFIWCFMFMMVLIRLSWKSGVKILLCLAAFISVCTWKSPHNHIYYNAGIAADRIAGEETDMMTYGKFYSPALFGAIKEDIGYNGEWSVAYGMHPGILIYNDIATLDGYFPIYPIGYKDRFRKLIAPELEQDPENRDYFDNWGGKAYIFSKDTESKQLFNIDGEESEMLIDPVAFREMGGKYVFSTVKVTNAETLGFRLLGVYGDGMPYVIHVYGMD
ncbi:MAG: DUF6044 family protein [Lachnospiraceae bacterium]|nr:DUF6044 family protein [Lachnospiraceae bacterium]